MSEPDGLLDKIDKAKREMDAAQAHCFDAHDRFKRAEQKYFRLSNAYMAYLQQPAKRAS